MRLSLCDQWRGLRRSRQPAQEQQPLMDLASADQLLTMVGAPTSH